MSRVEHKDPIIEQIRKARRDRDVSVMELSEILGVPADRIYKWDQGKAAPKFEDRQKVEKWIAGKLEEKVPREKEMLSKSNTDEAQTNATAGTPGGTLEVLMKTLIAATKSQNGLTQQMSAILERQEKELIQKVDRIDTNLNGLSAQAEKIMLDLESGRTVVLQSLARIEKKSPDELLDAADNLKNGLAASTGEPYKKSAKSNSRTGRQK